MKPPLLAIVSLLFTACSTLSPPAATGTVDHVVLVWLKHPDNTADRTALLETSRSLRQIPGLRSIDPGTALPSDRPSVDDSFDLAFVMRFDSPAALKAYGSHPVHIAARDRLLGLSRKVLIYDITR